MDRMIAFDVEVLDLVGKQVIQTLTRLDSYEMWSFFSRKEALYMIRVRSQNKVEPKAFY